ANTATGGIVGYISALMGIGGGTLSVPILAAFSVPMLKAVGTASTFGLVISIPAVLGFIWAGWNTPGLPPFSLGYVNLAAAAIIIPITVLTAPLGARIASNINQRALRLCFAVFLGLTGARMLISLYALKTARALLHARAGCCLSGGGEVAEWSKARAC